MSRCYSMSVQCRGKITLTQLVNIMIEEFGWMEIDTWEDKEPSTFTFRGEGSLSGGQGEESAHKQIVKRLQKVDKAIKVETCWTCLENLPTETYGGLE